MVIVRKVAGPGEKQCTVCKQAKPLDAFYVKNKKTGLLFARCKTCMAAEAKRRYDADPDKVNARSRAWQRSNPERAREIQAAYHERNKEARLAASREREAQPEVRANRAAYREANRERRRQYQVKYNDRTREQRRQKDAVYRQANQTELAERQRAWRRDNPDAYREIARRYKSANPEVINASTHRRRASINGNGGSWTAAEWRALKAHFERTCLMCHRREPEIKLTVDHVVPLARGGANSIDNIQPLCKGCNSSKHVQELDLRPAFELVKSVRRG